MLISIVVIVQLWEATLSHAPSLVPQLLACFPCLVEIMERSYEHLQVGLTGSLIIISSMGVYVNIFSIYILLIGG